MYLQVLWKVLKHQKNCVLLFNFAKNYMKGTKGKLKVPKNVKEAYDSMTSNWVGETKGVS
jgi:hypothetical protein